MVGIPLEAGKLSHKEGTTKIPVSLAFIFAILAVSTAAIFIRYAQQDAPSLVIAAYRLCISTLVLAPFALLRQRRELFGLTAKTFGLAVISGAFLALHFATWISSLEYTSVDSSVVLVTTTPLWVALFSPLFLKERLSRYAVIGMVVALVGGILIGLSDACSWSGNGLFCPDLAGFWSDNAFLGDFLALSGAWMAAGYLIAGRRLRSNMSLVTYTFIVYGAAGVILLLMAGFSRQALTGYPPMTYVWFLMLALLPQLAGHTTFNWALKHVPAGYVSVFLLGEPIGSTILAFLFLGEMPG
ncbi:hypothetical protein EHM76_03990, partial [bacterium]